MSHLNSWHPSARAVYLRHPDSKRVLELVQSNETHEFIALLRLCGYLPANAEDYHAQQDERQQRGKVKA